MNNRSIQIIVLTAAAAAMSLAQTTKSQPETDALKAVMTAAAGNKPDEVVSKANDFVAKFPDSSFKSAVLLEAAKASDIQQKYDQAVEEGDKAIEADPKNFQALTLVAGELAQHTKANDLTRADKLTKAEKYAKQALEEIPQATKPSDKMTDADWNDAKSLATAGVHYDLGLVAYNRRQMAAAAAEYKLAVDGVPAPDPIWLVRLGDAYLNSGKPDDAIPALDRVIATPGVLPQIKQLAENEKAQAQKAAKKK